MKKVLKNRIFIVIITMIICISGTLYATTKYNASDVSYNDTTVEKALNDLYKMKIDNDINYEIVNLYVSNNGTDTYAKTFELDNTKTYLLLMIFATHQNTVTIPYISSTDGDANLLDTSSLFSKYYKGNWYVVKNASTIRVYGTATNTNNGIVVTGISY